MLLKPLSCKAIFVSLFILVRDIRLKVLAATAFHKISTAFFNAVNDTKSRVRICDFGAC